VLGAASISCLREVLAEAGYTSANMADVRRAGGPGPGTRLEVLLDVFEYGRSVAREQMAYALAPLPVDHALRDGLIKSSADGLRAALHIQLYQQWWLLCDLPPKQARGPLPREYVLGAGGAAAALASAVIRHDVTTALDLCCGGGVQALHLSGHAREVTCGDLSPRALRFAAANALLNGLDWRLVQGSFTESVRGERFDLVVCHPPFVVGPGDVTYLYRDAGMRSDDLGRSLAGCAPTLLNPDGYMQYVAAWTHVTGTDWRDRVGKWLENTGLDAWAVQLDVRDAAEYVTVWSNDPGSASDRAWLRWFRDRRVEAVSVGLVTLRNAGRENPVIRVEDAAGSRLSGSDIAAWSARQDWLAGRDLLSCRFRPAEGARLRSAARYQDGAWASEGYTLTTASGPARTHQASDLVVAMISGCDGTVCLRDQLTRMAEQAGIEPAELQKTAIPAVIELIERQVLVPAGDEQHS
jgi:hypothetical protein